MTKAPALDKLDAYFLRHLINLKQRRRIAEFCMALPSPRGALLINLCQPWKR